MNAMNKVPDNSRYARCIESSKRVRWDIDEDVIRGRRFDTGHKFLPDGMSRTDGFTTLSSAERRFVSQVQGRTHANIFGLVERFINAKVLELTRDHRAGRPDCGRGAGPVQRRGAEAPDIVPPRRCDGQRGTARRLPFRFRPRHGRPRRARQKYLGGAGADLGY